MNPRIAVVMITRNGSGRIARSLRELTTLPQAPQVVVIDNGSTDATAELIEREFPEVTLIRAGRNLGAHGRNLGVECVDVPYVAFAEDDSWYEADALEIAVDLLDAHPDVAVLNAHVRVGEAGRPEPLHRDMVDTPVPDRPDLPGHRILSFLEGVSIVRRAAYRQVGGFDGRMGIGGPEEHLAADLLAAGWELRYVPAVGARHVPDHGVPPRRVRRLGLRNTLWFAWGRRPPRPAWRWTVHVLRSSPRDLATVAGLGQALLGLPRVLCTRRPLPPHLEAQMALLDAPKLRSTARSYGRTVKVR